MKKLKFLTFLISLLCFINQSYSSTLQEFEDTFVKISAEVGPAVVTISVVQNVKPDFPSNSQSGDTFLDDFLYFYFKGIPRKEFKQKGLGSGFILNKEGYILTNEHVIDNADEIDVTLPDGREFSAKFIGSDSRNDIALIKIEGENLPFVKLGNSDNVKPGQWSIALGNPFGNIVKNPNPTITTGIISAIHRTINIHEDDRIYGDLIQTDAAINQGNSGGPLVNLSGEVIGINTLIFSPSGGNVGIGFAIPINRGKMILDDLISGKEIQHGWLGIWLQDLDRDMVLQFGLTENQKGALVFKVEDDSPAQKAGLQSGDIIYDIDDHKINYSDDVSRIISGKKPGEKITMKIYRNGKSLVTEPVIAAREKTSSKAAAVKKTLLEWRGLTIDETGDNTTNNLKPAKGVVVTNVKYGSSAYHAQISKGDIIYSIAHNEINSKEDFSEIVKKYKSKDVLLHTSRGYVVLYDEK